jgi:2-amino-4-hydroxy-6-hydroxymethyldihydropteridine diphosphokinase
MQDSTAFVALGSNVGDRVANLNQAINELRSDSRITVAKVSQHYETQPVGGPLGQSPYLNAVAEEQTSLEPESLLATLLKVERKLGRIRHESNGPRVIDLDLLLYDDLVVKTESLTLPHPRMHNRLFVLEPLAEIAGKVFHPGFKRRISQLLDELQSYGAARGDLELISLRGPPVMRPRELTGLRALVTGSTNGIGQAIALELAEAGADVIVHGRRSSEAAAAVCAQALTQCVRSHWALGDLRSPAECDRLLESAWKEWNGLDICVNNAGADTLTGEAATWSFERKWQELHAVDVTATMKLSRTEGDRMKQQGAGVIINMGWDQAETGMEGDSGQLFAAAKAAVAAFTKSLALSLAPTVRVNCVAPGWIRTSWGEGASEPWQERVLRETPMRRWGTPEDVAHAVRWLVSPSAAYVTGQAIKVNGGAIR